MAVRGGPALGAPRGSFRPSLVFLGLVVVFGVAATLAWTGRGNAGVNVFFFVLAGWLVSLALHEYAHALVAYRGGDSSVARRGYLTLNPLKYSHPVLSIAFPMLFVIMGGIGLPGGAVAIERHRLRGRVWDSAVSAVGPAVNVVFALALIVALPPLADLTGHWEFWSGVAFLAFLEITVAILNLLPIPGMDGGNLLFPWLSPVWRSRYAKAAPYGFLALLALFFIPQLNRLFFDLVFWFVDLLGLPPWLYTEGYENFRFWT